VGNCLVIDHSDGTYWHIKKDGILVKVGDTVKRGDEIAIAGNTGALKHRSPALRRANWLVARLPHRQNGVSKRKNLF
jgi:hypothetical protein